MHLHLLAHTGLATAVNRVTGIRELRYDGRRWRRFDAEEDLHDNFAADGRHRPPGFGRNRLKGSLAQQPAPHVELGREAHTTEIAAVYVRNAVVFGQPLV